MNKILMAVILSASWSTASAAVFDITTVMDGYDKNFKFSGFHFAGITTEENSNYDPNLFDYDSDPMTGTQIARFLAAPVSGTYDDVSGLFNMMLDLDPDNFNVAGAMPSDSGYVEPGTVTFSGDVFFVDGLLDPASTLKAVFSNPSEDVGGYLMDDWLLFAAGLVNCCNAPVQGPNSFDGQTMSLWGSNGTTSKSPTLGLDLRIALIPTAVPVPAAAWLFGSGLLGLVAVSRRKSAG